MNTKTKKLLSALNLFFRIASVPFLLFFSLFLPAGTLHFWRAWIYLSIFFLLLLFSLVYFFFKNKFVIKQRLKVNEIHKNQKIITVLFDLFFIASLLLAGLDYRLHWSSVPAFIIFLSYSIIICGWFFAFWALKTNIFASSIVEVALEQKVIHNGPYAWVRHPFYAGILLFLFASPIALGSLWMFLAILPFPILYGLRILQEEKVLLQELSGYKDYCEKVRYRLIPFIW